jgi:hypothetical protein
MGVRRVLAPLVSFVLAGLALAGWAQRPGDLLGVLIWFAAAIVLHDLLVLPLYTVLHHVTVRRLPGQAAAYVRVPAIISALLLVVLFPTISGFGAHRFHGITGLHAADYFGRWLLTTAVLFALSGAVWTYRGWRGRFRAGSPTPSSAPRPAGDR